MESVQFKAINSRYFFSAAIKDLVSSKAQSQRLSYTFLSSTNLFTSTKGVRNRVQFFVVAASSSQGERRERPRGPPGVDTRIHWENEDDGWVGESLGGGNVDDDDKKKASDLLGDKFADLLNQSADSHYQFLGIPVDADAEEIKTAYRRLSKEYHPDTTSLPQKMASEKFMKLREVYNVLSGEETRRFYDWTLAQQTQAEKMRVKLEDPRIQELENYVPVPDVINRLEGRNMELSDEAKSAITIDVFIIIFAICCFVYVMVFREPYY